MNKPDSTKTESGREQYDRTGPGREPSIGYQDGDRINANDIGQNRSAKQDKIMNDAQRAATGNRRDQPTNSEADFADDDIGKDIGGPAHGPTHKRH